MATLQPSDAYILALPNEVLEQVLSPEVREESHYINTKIGISALCSVCKRFRDVFLWRLYHTIRCHDIRDVRPFLEVLPFQGARHIVHLDLVLFPIDNLAGYDLLSMLYLFLLSTKELKSLRSLRLDIHPTPRSVNNHGVTVPAAVERAPADPMPLSSEVVNAFNSVLRSLPEQLRSLSLSGFCLEDATAGLAAAKFPSLRALSLDLDGTDEPYDLSYPPFLQGMPLLKSIELPVQWCPRVKWFRQAFDGRSFKRIKIGFTGDIFAAEKHMNHGDSLCAWNQCIVTLLKQSSSILKSLNIGTISLTIPRNSVFPVLTSLTIVDIEFGPEADKELKALLMPFVRSPLESLKILECHDPPDVLINLIDGYWPKLKKLSVSKLTTYRDKYDPPGVGRPYPRPLGYDAPWDPVSRRKLEAICEQRGVRASLDWGYL
ncbi:uncharacterized protein EV420DRAFT_1647257 [Desarmillaria tabescens]|uniref:Uncharacterized protein n=1 Tax=Armillaria tabescens TaxID=1929756 RepID=A0AA39JYM3_ARMTA|nr:uncharacterized protein EV420DRAFT_1647257 [Desarmillaria tabescens]KAK0448978.1 hypothetical protein EV420DRAFT_1647257 [Desarmillaria tabescens]